MKLILASGSVTRQHMLRAAGLEFEAMSPGVDEDMAKESMRAEGLSPREQAAALAALKAISVSEGHPDALVLGADQMLVLDHASFDKPRDRNAARAQLRALRGHHHELATAVVAARAGAVIWRHTEAPRLKMRNFSDGFIEDYLDRAGESVLSSVGAYQIEGLGAHLFERIDGDHFAVLGLPLLPLLAFLREQGLAPA